MLLSRYSVPGTVVSVRKTAINMLPTSRSFGMVRKTNYCSNIISVIASQVTLDKSFHFVGHSFL